MEECPHCGRKSAFGIQSLVDEGFAVLDLGKDGEAIKLFTKRIDGVRQRLNKLSNKESAERRRILDDILLSALPPANKVDELVERLRKEWFCE